MKIFNWVHRRFLHNVHSPTFSHHDDGVARNVKKADPVRNNAETKALLEHVGLVDVIDGWRDGILTIGTFGFDPLKPLNQQKECMIAYKEEFDYEEEEEDEEEYSFNNEDDEEEVEDEGELNPLVFTAAYRSGFEKDIGSKPETNDVKPDQIMNLDGFSLTPFVESPELGFDSYIAANDQGKKKGERTTLADLFLADSDMKRKKDSNEVMPDSGKKPAFRTKNGLSFAKKLIPRVKEDSRPIRKLHLLMKKMLKRKIHPELEGKINNSDGEVKPGSIIGLDISDGAGANETVSLL